MTHNMSEKKKSVIESYERTNKLNNISYFQHLQCCSPLGTVCAASRPHRVRLPGSPYRPGLGKQLTHGVQR